MAIFLKLHDIFYPVEGEYHVRKIARAILLNDEGKIALHVVNRDDEFCNQRYLETPGGGLEGDETFEDGLRREVYEEVGCRCEILAYLGEIEDEYNLINRHNVNRFFLAKKIGDSEPTVPHSNGDSLIEKTVWMSLDEAIKAYELQEDKDVAGLVKRRELPILLEAKRLLAGGKPV